MYIVYVYISQHDYHYHYYYHHCYHHCHHYYHGSCAFYDSSLYTHPNNECFDCLNNLFDNKINATDKRRYQ